MGYKVFMSYSLTMVLHHKFNMQRIKNENCVKFVHSYIHKFDTQISCIKITFDTQINVLINEVWIYIYESMNVT
jgi:hypothetical protein